MTPIQISGNPNVYKYKHIFETTNADGGGKNYKKGYYFFVHFCYSHVMDDLYSFE